MAHVSIVRGGNLMAFGVGGGPPPADVSARCEAEMRYTHRRAVRPGDAFDADGVAGRVTFRNVKLHATDRYGRVVCGLGYQSRLVGILDDLGHTFDVADVLPPVGRRPPPDRHAADWGRMAEAFARQGYDLRAGQDRCLAAIAGAATGRGLVEAPPAFGKSFLFTAYALAHPNARIHVVVDGLDILHRIRREMARFVPNLGFVGDGSRKFGRVTLVSASSLGKVEPDDPTHPHFADTVLCDEVDTLATGEHWENLVRYEYCRMYGFSATLEHRWDGADAALESVFGPVLFSMSYPEAVAAGLVVPITVEWMPFGGPDPTAGLSRPDAVNRHGVWQNSARNKLIMDRVLALDPDDQTLILADTIDHLVHLKRHYPPLVIVYDDLPDDRYAAYVRAGLLDPDRDPPMTPARRHALSDMFTAGDLRSGGRRLAAANRVWDTGVSFEMLEVLVVAHAKASRRASVQGPGRVSRTSAATGKTGGLVIDVYDTWSDRFRDRAVSRGREYGRQGWTQEGVPRPSRVRKHGAGG